MECASIVALCDLPPGKPKPCDLSSRRRVPFRWKGSNSAPGPAAARRSSRPVGCSRSDLDADGIPALTHVKRRAAAADIPLPTVDRGDNRAGTPLTPVWERCRRGAPGQQLARKLLRVLL